MPWGDSSYSAQVVYPFYTFCWHLIPLAQTSCSHPLQPACRILAGRIKPYKLLGLVFFFFFEYKVLEGIGHHTGSSTTKCDLSTPPLALHQSCSPLHPQLSLWLPMLLPLLPHCGDKDKQAAATVQRVQGSCLQPSAPSGQGSPHSPGEALKVGSHVTASPDCCAGCSSLGRASFTCCDFTPWPFPAPGWQRVQVLPFSTSHPPGLRLHNLPKPQTLTQLLG